MGWFEKKINQGSEGDRADYESRSENADPNEQSDRKTKSVMSKISAQRSARSKWGKPEPTGEEHHDRY